jgi:hypothetical protein
VVAASTAVTRPGFPAASNAASVRGETAPGWAARALPLVGRWLRTVPVEVLPEALGTLSTYWLAPELLGGTYGTQLAEAAAGNASTARVVTSAIFMIVYTRERAGT